MKSVYILCGIISHFICSIFTNCIPLRKAKEIVKMKQKVKCFFGFHKERWLGMELPYYQEVLMKCDCCGKYNLWHTGINAQTGWKKNINKFPEIVKNHIKENNL